MKSFKTTFLIFLIVLISFEISVSQGTPTKITSPSRTGWVLQSNSDILAIDSLNLVIESMNERYHVADSLYKAERFTTAELRDEIIKIDDYRKSLEETISNFKGENLKLNQSNRILIVFNSMVAVLLVITLVFFLKKFGRKKVVEQKKSNPVPVTQTTEKFASFEDKLVQLERLGKLREKGLLSEDEFSNEKQRILGK